MVYWCSGFSTSKKNHPFLLLDSPWKTLYFHILNHTVAIRIQRAIAKLLLGLKDINNHVMYMPNAMPKYGHSNVQMREPLLCLYLSIAWSRHDMWAFLSCSKIELSKVYVYRWPQTPCDRHLGSQIWMGLGLGLGGRTWTKWEAHLWDFSAGPQGRTMR